MIGAIVAAQHRDPQLQPLLNFLGRNEVPAIYSPAERRKLESRAKQFSLDRSHDPPALFLCAKRQRTIKPAAFSAIVPRLVIPLAFHRTLLTLFHDSPFGGHLGVTHTFYKISQAYYWDSLYQDVMDFVGSCPVCQTEKIHRHSLRHTELRMQRPTSPFSIVSMDFIGPFEQSHDFKYVLTFIDHFTKFAIAVPCETADSAVAATLFVNEVVCRYGAPHFLLSDNGSAFNNAMMTEVCAMLRIKAQFTTAFHPQANGQIERFNGTLKQILRSLCSNDRYKTTWMPLLQAAVFAYNTSVHESTGMTPFYALFGREAHFPLIPASAESESLGDQPREEFAQLLQTNLHTAHQFIAQQLDQRHLETHQTNMEMQNIPVFMAGDLVYRRNAIRANYKSGKLKHTLEYLEPPFRVLARVSENVYRIQRYDLDAKRLVGTHRNVFVSDLKKFVDRSVLDRASRAAPVDHPVADFLPYPHSTRRAPADHLYRPTDPASAVAYLPTSGEEPRVPTERHRIPLPPVDVLQARSDAVDDSPPPSPRPARMALPRVSVPPPSVRSARPPSAPSASRSVSPSADANESIGARRHRLNSNKPSRPSYSDATPAMPTGHVRWMSLPSRSSTAPADRPAPGARKARARLAHAIKYNFTQDY